MEIFNLSGVDSATFNGEEVESIVYDGVEVWSSGLPVITLSVGTQIDYYASGQWVERVIITPSAAVKDDLTIIVALMSAADQNQYVRAEVTLSSGSISSGYANIGELLDSQTAESQVELVTGLNISTINGQSVTYDAYETDNAIYYEKDNPYINI